MLMASAEVTSVNHHGNAAFFFFFFFSPEPDVLSSYSWNAPDTQLQQTLSS